MVSGQAPHVYRFGGSSDRAIIRRRIAGRVEDLVTDFEGTVFRFVSPRFASTADLFAGKGALFCSGRWLVKDYCLATYTALDPETALAESLAAGRYYGFPVAQSTPMVLVSASVKLKKVVDLTDGRVRQRLRFSERAMVECDWRSENQSGTEAMTQAYGWGFAESGVEAILAPSAALSKGRNLIVFPSNLEPESHLTVTREVEWPDP